MVFPLIPIACLAAFLGGGTGLGWYYSKSREEQEEADRLAANLALKLYQKSLKNLTRDQAENVAAMVQRQLGA